MTRLTLPLAMLGTITVAAGGQLPSKVPNWVDTITVGRLPTGGCEWSAAARRIRPGKPGTTTMPGTASERTCTVLAYNYTTGSGQERPMVLAFGFVQDGKRPIPKGAVLNFADTFTVNRLPDGNCDWAKTPARQGKPGSSSSLGEVRTRDCWGVVYNITRLVPPNTAGLAVEADTTEVVNPSDGAPMSPTAFQDVRAAVLATFTNPDTIRITSTRVKGDSAWVSVRNTPRTWTRYTLVERGGAWRIVERVPGRLQ